MTLRWPVWLMLATCALVWLSVILWGYRGHREADRANARADSTATEHAAAQLRELGYQVTLEEATTERDLLRQISDSLAAVLASHRAIPTTVEVVRVTASGATTSPASPDTGSVWRAEIRDGPLSLEVQVDSPLRRLSVAWHFEAHGSLIHSIMPDGRLMVAARSDDPRVEYSVPSLYWTPPKPPPGPSRLRWLLYGAIAGAAAWEIAR